MQIIYLLILIGDLSFVFYLYKYFDRRRGYTFWEWLQVTTSSDYAAFIYASIIMTICCLFGFFVWYLLFKSAINASVPVSREKIMLSMLSLICSLFFLSFPIVEGLGLNDIFHCLGVMCSCYTYSITKRLWYYTFWSEANLRWSLMLFIILFIIQVVVFFSIVCFTHLVIIKFIDIWVPFMYGFNLALVITSVYVYDFYVRVQMLIYQLPREYPRLRASKKLFNFLDSGAGLIFARVIMWFVILSSVDWSIYT